MSDSCYARCKTGREIAHGGGSLKFSAAVCDSQGCYPWWEEIKGNVLAAVQDHITVVTDGLGQDEKVMKYLIYNSIKVDTCHFQLLLFDQNLAVV